jgi:hypothetical protein
MVDYERDVDAYQSNTVVTGYAGAVVPSTEPLSYDEAINSTDAVKWKEAMHEEIAAMKRNDSWSLIKRTPDMNVIGSKWVYNIKYKSDGTVEKFKARLVAQGYKQIEGVDYGDTFAPVMRYKSLRVLLSLAKAMNYEV